MSAARMASCLSQSKLRKPAPATPEKSIQASAISPAATMAVPPASAGRSASASVSPSRSAATSDAASRMTSGMA